MKKMIIAFSFLAFAFTASAANSVEKPESVKKMPSKSEKQFLKVLDTKENTVVICVFSPIDGSGACGAGETEAEALLCLYYSLFG